MPAPYLLHVNSRPKGEGVDDEIWKKWYITEHLPDLHQTGTSTRSSFYEESFDFTGAPGERHIRGFLALYQTEFAEPLRTDNYLKGVRHGSDLFPKSKETSDNGDFDARIYKLLTDFDPKGTGEKPAPYLVTVEMDPTDEADFERWYAEEHLDMLSKLPGYRRSNRWTINSKTALTIGEPPKYLAIHEVDDMRTAFDSKEAAAANATPWTIKHIKDSKVFIARGWKLLHSEGF